MMLEVPVNDSEPKEKLNTDNDGKDNTGDETVEIADVLPSVQSSLCETESAHGEDVIENTVLGSEEKSISSKSSEAQGQLGYIKSVSLHTDDSNSSNLEESLNSDIESSSVRSDSSKCKDQEAKDEVQQKEPETRMTLRQSSRLRRQPLHVPHRRGRGRGRGISRPKRTRIKTLAVINSSTDSQEENDAGFTSSRRHERRLGPRKQMRNLRKHRQVSTDDDDGFSDPDVNKKTAKNLIFNNATFQAMLRRSSSRIILDDAEEEEKSQDEHSLQQPVLTKSPQSKNEDQADDQGAKNSGDVSPKICENNEKDTKSTPSVELVGNQLTENPKVRVLRKTASTVEVSESLTTRAKRLKNREAAISDKNVRLPISKRIVEKSQGKAQEDRQGKDKRQDENCDSENAKHEDSPTQEGGQVKVGPAAQSERNVDDDIEETLRRLDGPSPHTVLRSPPCPSEKLKEQNCARKLLTGASGDQEIKETESSSNESDIKNSVKSNSASKEEVGRKETSDQYDEISKTPEIAISSEQPVASNLKPSTSKVQEKTEQLAVEDSLKEADEHLKAESSETVCHDTPALSSVATSNIVSENTCQGKESSSDNRSTNTNNNGGRVSSIGDDENSCGGSGTGGDGGGDGNDSGSNSNSPVRNVLLKSVQYSDGINDHDSEYRDSMWNMAFLTPERRERDEISPPQPSSPGRSDSSTIRRNLSRQQLYPAIVTLQPGSFESPVRRERSDSSFNLHIPSYSEMEEKGPSSDENVEIIFDKNSAKKKECAISKGQRVNDNQQVCSREEGSSVSGEDCASQSISNIVLEGQGEGIKAIDDKENSPGKELGTLHDKEILFDSPSSKSDKVTQNSSTISELNKDSASPKDLGKHSQISSGMPEDSSEFPKRESDQVSLYHSPTKDASKTPPTEVLSEDATDNELVKSAKGEMESCVNPTRDVSLENVGEIEQKNSVEASRKDSDKDLGVKSCDTSAKDTSTSVVKDSVEESIEISVKASGEVSSKDSSEVSGKVPVENFKEDLSDISLKNSSKVSAKDSHEISVKDTNVSLKDSQEVSVEDSCDVSVEVSSEVSKKNPQEVSVKDSSDASPKDSSDASQRTPVMLHQRTPVMLHQRTPVMLHQRTSVILHQKTPMKFLEKIPLIFCQGTLVMFQWRSLVKFQRRTLKKFQRRTPVKLYQRTPVMLHQRTPGMLTKDSRMLHQRSASPKDSRDASPKDSSDASPKDSSDCDASPKDASL
nr:serine/threonine-protein kinase pakD-like [Penaeus vannamei]